MVKLRLTRMGATKAPFYRIVAMDSRKARDGKYIDQIGFYNPVSEPKQIVIDADKAKEWLANGAQPTDYGIARFSRYSREEVIGDDND